MSSLESRVEDLERRVADIADREAIRDLTCRYCQDIQRGDADAVGALFCDDGCMESDALPALGRPASVIRGRDELLRVYRETLGDFTPKPFIHNHVIELDGERARGVCSVEIRAVQEGTAYNVAGHYEDAYRRECGEWRFERRRFVVYHWVPATEGWA